MELLKNIMKYLLILLGIIVFIALSICAVMFFVPSVSIFGFRFRSSHQSYIMLMKNLSQVDSITVKTNSYDVSILPNVDPAELTSFKIVVDNDYVGFVNGTNDKVLVNQQDIDKISTLSMTEFLQTEVDINNEPVLSGGVEVKIPGAYIFDLTEVTGLVSYGHSRIKIYVPQTFGSVKYNLETSNGTINFLKNSENTYQKVSTSDINIKVNSKKGTFSIDNVAMQSSATLDVKNYLGRVVIHSDIGGNVKISSRTGSFIFNNIGSNQSSGIENSSLSLNKVVLLISGDNPYVYFKNLNGSLKLESPSGLIEGDTVSGDIITNTENGIIKVKKALGGALMNSTSGSVEIEQVGDSNNLLHSINITTKSGMIKLGGDGEDGAIYGRLSSVVSTSGKIVLNNVKNDLNRIESNSGSINITFEKSSTAKSALVSSVSGAVNIYNINGAVNASTQNSAPINATFYLMNGASTFVTDNGNINLTLVVPTNDENKQFSLTVQNKLDKVDVSIGAYQVTSFGGIEKVDNFYTIQNNFPSDAVNPYVVLAKTNSGKITVRN